ncbi:MAG: protein CoxF [Verrucomicrobiae bacterium]|nr:protein CoxF [Verrucomicrobiae bacterium]
MSAVETVRNVATASVRSDREPAVIELDAVELDAEAKTRRNRRSIAIALALGFLVILFYAATMVRLGANVMNRAL